MNLDANTTYYFRMGALNLWENPNYGVGDSTVTLAQTVSIGNVDTIPSSRSITVRWVPLVDSPQKDSCEGYLLEASTISSFTGAVIYSSSAFDSSVSTLIVSDVWPNTTYYMRLGSFNWNLRPNYLYLPSVKTDTGETLSSPPIDGIYQSSISVSWSPIDCDGYVLAASTKNFEPLVLFS